MLIDGAAISGSPFAVLTAVVAPAVLTNASSVLCLGTSNRLARVVDRTRVVTSQLASLPPASPDCLPWADQLQRLQVRAQLLLKALRLLYGSLGAFAAAALFSVIGSLLDYYSRPLAFRGVALLALVIGGFAVLGLVSGCVLMVRETRLAVRALAIEAELARSPHRIPQ